VLWIGSTISNVGTWMQIVAQSWLMYQLTSSPFALGLVGLTRAVPMLALPVVGLGGVFYLNALSFGAVLPARPDRSGPQPAMLAVRALSRSSASA
jgi:Transmembrane secretion effector